jgi:hypothetical protein
MYQEISRFLRQTLSKVDHITSNLSCDSVAWLSDALMFLKGGQLLDEVTKGWFGATIHGFRPQYIGLSTI